MYLKEDNENEILQDYVKEQDTDSTFFDGTGWVATIDRWLEHTRDRIIYQNTHYNRQ